MDRQSRLQGFVKRWLAGRPAGNQGASRLLRFEGAAISDPWSQGLSKCGSRTSRKLNHRLYRGRLIARETRRGPTLNSGAGVRNSSRSPGGSLRGPRRPGDGGLSIRS